MMTSPASPLFRDRGGRVAENDPQTQRESGVRGPGDWGSGSSADPRHACGPNQTRGADA